MLNDKKWARQIARHLAAEFDLKGSDPSVYVSLYMFDCGEAELAAHECAKGTKVFEVNYGTDVEVVLASLATERLARRAYGISARR